MNRRMLYLAGMAAGVVYLVGDILGGIVTPNYNYVANAVSELLESGAENRLLFSAFFFVHALMIVLFGVGVMAHHPYRRARSMFVSGALLLTVGVCHALSSSVFPMDPVGEPATFPGVMHLVLVGISVLSIIVLLPLGAQGAARHYGWRSFRVFSYVCLPILILSGVLSPVFIANGVEAMGLTERITGYTFYLWLFVLAFELSVAAQGNRSRSERLTPA